MALELSTDFPPSPSGVRVHVLPWEEPLPSAAAAWLARDWGGREPIDRAQGGPLDLSACLVVVPTRQSGRRLREALAAIAAEKGQAVFPPRVVLPETLVTLGMPTAGVATRAEHQLAWIEVLQNIDQETFRDVFPVEPPSRSFTWARGLAAQFIRLQASLAEAGLRIADVPTRAPRAAEDFPEVGRWVQLAELERRVDAALSGRGLSDPNAARLRFASRPVLPPGVKRLVLLATPDPLPLALHILGRHAARDMPIDVVIHGPDHVSTESLFDGWGRPRPDVWTQRTLAWTNFEEHVRLCADPAAQAAHLVSLACQYRRPEEILAIGVADAEVLAPLERELARAGIPVFNPAGRPQRLEGLHALVRALAEWARSSAWDAATALLRCPDVLAWLKADQGKSFSEARLLGELDALTEAHLPPTLDVAIEHAEKHPEKASAALLALRAVSDLRHGLVDGMFPENAALALQAIFAHRQLDTDSRLIESAEAWTETLGEVGNALEKFGPAGPSHSDAWEFALASFGERQRFGEKPADALELNGWLELLWEDAPHLVVAGLNDGRVPESVVGDAFLPESLRVCLGLKSNAARFARDAYLLQALAASRTARGRLDVLVGKVSMAGDPLRPSRLLLRCPDDELPGRVKWLFRDAPASQSSLPWTRAWRIRPNVASPPARVSVTALHDWLVCPFRFYLKHVLRMKRVELSKAELDARDFGTLMHSSLQRLMDDDARDCTDPNLLRDHLLRNFESVARQQYGERLTLPLVVQFESARQRLRKAAEVQARERAAGWRIERVEWRFELPLGGLTVRGTIDRVDRHVDDTRRVRVLDYKTADSPSTASAAHLRAIRPGDELRADWKRVRVGGRERVWTDLQLPLYCRAIMAEFGGGVECACGYFNLPKAAGETAVELWSDLLPDLQSAAERCAEGATKAIAAGEFWPPAEIPGDEDWTELFHHGAAESVDPVMAGYKNPHESGATQAMEASP